MKTQHPSKGGGGQWLGPSPNGRTLDGVLKGALGGRTGLDGEVELDGEGGDGLDGPGRGWPLDGLGPCRFCKRSLPEDVGLFAYGGCNKTQNTIHRPLHLDGFPTITWMGE